jgi:hypothetical protein
LDIRFLLIRGIWTQRTSGRDDKWPKPSVPGGNKRQSPDFRKESGLCVFRFKKSFLDGKVRAVKSAAALKQFGCGSTLYRRQEGMSSHIFPVEGSLRRAAGLSIPSGMENSGIQQQ